MDGDYLSSTLPASKREKVFVGHEQCVHRLSGS